MAHHGTLVKDTFGQDDHYSGIFYALPDVDLSQALQIVLSWGSRTRRDSRDFRFVVCDEVQPRGENWRSRSD